ncbi:MAG: hypothetical protein AAGG38_09240 [Planctomycetota bacterium]
MPIDPSDMVSAIDDALASSPAAVVSVTIDGTTTNWKRLDALKERDYWLKQVATTRGTRRPVRGVDLSRGGF